MHSDAQHQLDSQAHMKTGGPSYDSSILNKASYKRKMADQFKEFDKMVKRKYDLDDHMYDNMSNEDRNLKLKELLEKDNIIVFPDENIKLENGMP